MAASMVPAGRPAWSRSATIGDYGGSLDKRNSETEGDAPYAWAVYCELRNMRGSAFTKDKGTLVHCENLALARVLAFRNFRCPEKFTCNAQQPATADEGIDYWVKVLDVPAKPTDQRWQLRQRCAAHFKAGTELNLSTIRAALQDLLGEIYVNATFNEGTALSASPTLTYWPGVNDGDESYSLGGGTWASERSHLYVEIQQPAGMSRADFLQIVNVQMFHLLDRILPAYATFGRSLGGGFYLDISNLDFTGLTPE